MRRSFGGSILKQLGIARLPAIRHRPINIVTLLCSTLLISESGLDGVFERFSSGFAVEFSSELERSEILCEAIF